MPAFLQPRPDFEILPDPYALNQATLAALVFREGVPGALQKLVDDTLNAATTQGRFRVRFDGHALAGVFRFGEVRSTAAWGYLRYQEAALVLLVEDTRTHGVYLFNPVIVLDSSLALLAGREVHGYPKKMARITAPSLEQTVASLDAKTQAAGGINARVEVEGFNTTAANERAGWQVIFDAQWSGPFAGGLLVNAKNLAPPVFARSLDQAPKAVELFKQTGAAVSELVMTFLGGMLGNLQLSGIFLKQFLDCGSTTNACLCQVVTAPYRPTATRSVLPCLGAITFHNPASFPLASALGLGAQAGKPLQPMFGFIADMDWALGPGQVLP